MVLLFLSAGSSITTVGAGDHPDHALLHTASVHLCTPAVAFERGGARAAQPVEFPRSARRGRPSPARGASRRRRFKPGATLTHAGGRGAEVLVLVSGRVKVSVDTEDGREVVLQFCGPGELIGELAVIDARRARGPPRRWSRSRRWRSRRRFPGADRAAARASPWRSCAASCGASATPTAGGSSSPPHRLSAGWRRGWPSCWTATASPSRTARRSRFRSPRRSSPAGRGPRARRRRRRCKRCAGWELIRTERRRIVVLDEPCLRSQAG